MQKHVVIFLIAGIISSSQVRAESVLVGLGDYNSQQNISDWRKGMIEDQSFEVELSEFTDPVWFVSYMPAEGDNDVTIRLIQQNEVLEEFENYLPDNAQGMNFTSLDAVSFVDYNLDGETDIFIVKTWDNLTVSAVYDGTVDVNKHFNLNRELSDAMTRELSEHTISNMIAYTETVRVKKEGIFLDDIPGHFAYGSGAGAWGSGIDLNEDGTFAGHFWDSDMGGSGDGYDMTASHCECTGKFGNVEKHGDYYYSMTLEEYTPEQEKGTSWISEETNGEVTYRMMNIITDPRGIYPGTVYYLFLPGAPLSELPVVLTEPMIGVAVSQTEPKVLLNCVLYNVDQGAAFSGYD